MGNVELYELQITNYELRMGLVFVLHYLYIMAGSVINTWNQIDGVLLSAIREDIGNGDITTLSLIPEKHTTDAELVAKADFVVAGLPFFQRVFGLVDSSVGLKIRKKDGSVVKSGTVIAGIKGKTGSILMAERTALNILQRTSGIATLTKQFVRAVTGLNVRIADTRKTAPGLRYFDKYGVKAGGGHNHRFGLFDGVLIKDNHITAVGGVGKAIKKARAEAHHLLKIEVEVKNLSEVEDALAAGADIIMLDNMSVEMMKNAVNVIRSKSPEVLIEASGNMNPDNVRAVAGTGIDLISIGALTHSAPAADISLKFRS